jgi:hypothetical protein
MTDEQADEDVPIRGEVRLVDHRRVSHGLFRKLRDDLTADQEFVRDLEAYLLVLPEGAVFTHVTGARLLGWQLPKLPEQVPVFAAVQGDAPRPRRHGLICSRLVRETRPVKRAGLPVDAPEEILLRASRDLGVLDLVIMIDSARRAGDVDGKQMQEVLASGRPGVRMLRTAWELSSDLAESGGETVTRLFHVAMDVPVQPQVELFDDNGLLIGRADLLVTGTWQVHEYDGEHHRSKAQHRTDLRRERGWAGTPYVRRGFVLDDLLNHSLVVMHELDRALERPHDLRRIERWRRIVGNSLYSEQGRQRVMNRWRRQAGLIDWSRTA